MKTVNVQSLSDKAKNYARKNNCTPQQAMQYFAFERFLERLSVSGYRDNFILKGGLLLSSIMGIDLRTTMDIDANITGMNFGQDEIKETIARMAKVIKKDHVYSLLCAKANAYPYYSDSMLRMMKEKIRPDSSFNAKLNSEEIEFLMLMISKITVSITNYLISNYGSEKINEHFELLKEYIFEPSIRKIMNGKSRSEGDA